MPEARAPDDVLLGFDFGTRRIGVAVGNRITGAARPLAVVDAPPPGRWALLGKLIAQWQPDALVVGIPRHPDGTAHEMTAAAQRFARQLGGRFELPVSRVDERYSTAVLPPDRDSDADAAALILQQYLDAGPAGGATRDASPT